MGAFILGGLVLAASVVIAIFVAFAQGMATAPHYDESPIYIAIGGAFLAVAIMATHWLHMGW